MSIFSINNALNSILMGQCSPTFGDVRDEEFDYSSKPDWVSKPQIGFIVGESTCRGLGSYTTTRDENYVIALKVEALFYAQEDAIRKKCGSYSRYKDCKSPIAAGDAQNPVNSYIETCFTDDFETGVKAYLLFDVNTITCWEKMPPFKR